MAKIESPTILWFLTGLAVGATVSLLTASRSGKGHQVYARAKEARDLAKDAASVVERGRRLRRPLSES